MVKIIENYTLHEQIGEGEYGKVYRGIDSRTKKQVAVKVINVKKFKQYPKLQQCTLNQIEVLSKIQSPHIVKFIQILKTANNFYFFYEFCNQGTLEDIIKSKGTLTQPQCLQYLSQILQAFKILTSKHIMHRDLKPSNILINDGYIKIADFGFCKSLESHRDLAQTMLGSPIYMAPEVLKGQIYTIKADIWSLGVVIYEMLYGFCPYEERSIARLINLLDKEEVVFNSQINRISPDLEELLRKMLIKDHFKRIGWKEIYQYKVNGVPLLKSYTSDKDQKEKEKQRERERDRDRQRERQKVFLSQPNRQEELKQVKNFNNISSERPVSRTSFDISAQDPSTTQKLPLTPPTLFKKQAPPQKTSISPSPLSQPYPSSTSGTTSTMNTSNKQNISLTSTTEPMSTKIRSRVIRNKIRYYIKLAADVLQYNYCPEITVQLCLKIYQLLYKEVSKVDDYIVSSQQRQALSQAIKNFQQQSSKVKQTVSGPLLNYYIKSIQQKDKDNFQSTNSNKDSKDSIVHCLSLLDLNDISTKEKFGEYGGFGKEKLISELYQKIIRNTI